MEGWERSSRDSFFGGWYWVFVFWERGVVVVVVFVFRKLLAGRVFKELGNFFRGI